MSLSSCPRQPAILGAAPRPSTRDERRDTLVERATRTLRRLLRGDIQRQIAREYRRAFPIALRGFPATVELPTPYGRYLPERVVELLLARLLYVPRMRVLDVGHANGMSCHRAMLRSLPGPLDVTGIDIAEPGKDARAFYRESVRGSIAATPFRSDSFDLIWCISSLEHVGMDNTGYGMGDAARGATPEAAVTEMVRLLKPGGSLLMTLPYGRYEDHGWFRNFDAAHVQDLLAAVRKRVLIRELYYEYSPEQGWRGSDPARLRHVGYGDQRNAGSAGLAALVLWKPRVLRGQDVRFGVNQSTSWLRTA